MKKKLKNNLLKMKNLVTSLKINKNNDMLFNSDIIKKLRQVSCDTKNLTDKELKKK